MYDALTGKVTDFKIEGVSKAKIAATGKNTGAAIENVDIKFGYCTEFIIMLDKEFDEKTEESFKAFLSSIGDSIAVSYTHLDVYKRQVCRLPADL